ncbi:MAG TPA: PAS domain-containing protein [Rhizomicrobium sp.]|jgi:hypothetical protein|nr:PAS domain-containing protein [Rhizomicrobium sp.]
MKHRNSHLLVGYWSRLRSGNGVPDQTALDPRAIKRILSHVFILDATDETRPRYRLAGTSHCDRYGMELRGMNFLAQWDVQSRGTITQLLRLSLLCGEPICLSSVAETERGVVEMETVLAPLTFAGSTPSRFIGISQITGDGTVLFNNAVLCERLVDATCIKENEAFGSPDGLNFPPPSKFRTLAKPPHLKLVINRDEKPANSSEANVLMRRLVDALEIVTPPLRAVP